MILTGPEIKTEVKRGRICIDPFIPENINPNSYNFHLGQKVTLYRSHVLDTKCSNQTYTIDIPPTGLLLEPSRLFLGHIEEIIGSNFFVPLIKGRSSIGRLGLFINITSDLIDQGAFGQWSLQFHAIQPLIIYPGMAIGQMTFWKPLGQPLLYNGKYQHQTGSQVSSQSFKDFT